MAGKMNCDKYVVTVSSSDYVNYGYVVSGAVLCVGAEFSILATEAVVNESRAEL